METEALAPLVYPCDKCGRGFTLLLLLNGLQVCNGCWVLMGRPSPRPPTSIEIHEAELATRERMLQRGSADRHMVRSGKS